MQPWVIDIRKSFSCLCGKTKAWLDFFLHDFLPLAAPSTASHELLDHLHTLSQPPSHHLLAACSAGRTLPYPICLQSIHQKGTICLFLHCRMVETYLKHKGFLVAASQRRYYRNTAAYPFKTTSEADKLQSMQIPLLILPHPWRNTAKCSSRRGRAMFFSRKSHMQAVPLAEYSRAGSLCPILVLSVFFPPRIKDSTFSAEDQKIHISN